MYKLTPAIALAFAMLVAAVGTIFSAPPGPEGCSRQVCGAGPEASPSLQPWEATLAQAACRTREGFLQMAGLREPR